MGDTRPARDLLLLTDAAGQVGRDPATLRRWARQGLLNRYRVAGERQVYVRWSELQEHLRRPPLLVKRGRPARGSTPDIDVTKVDGPHDPGRTVAAAELCVESLQYLSYATLADSGGIGSPGDVHRILGELSTAMSRLRQTVGQLSGCLDRHAQSGRLAIVDQGAPYADDPSAGVLAARWQFELAAQTTRELEAALGEVQRIISGMSLSGSDLPGRVFRRELDGDPGRGLT
jgi:hypothetical protein